MFKLAVGLAWTSPFIWTRFTMTALNIRHPQGWEVKWIQGDGWCPARRHMRICEQALAWGADVICMLGSDQVYEPDILERMATNFLAGYYFNCASVPARGYFAWNKEMRPFQPMAWRWKPVQPDGNGHVAMREYRGQALDGDMVEIVDLTQGPRMLRVNFIGSGALMYGAEYLPLLKKPWFYETINQEDYTRQAIMDVLFVHRMQTEAGAQLWLDRTIKIKHIHPFEIDETFQYRFDDWMVPGKGDPAIAIHGTVETAPR